MIGAILPSGTRLEASFPTRKALLDVILTAILTPLTGGLVLFFFPYYFQRDIIDHTFIVDGDGKRVGSLDCTLTFGNIIKHVIPWMLLSLITLGVAFLFFQVRVAVFVYNNTEVNWFEENEITDHVETEAELISTDVEPVEAPAT